MTDDEAGPGLTPFNKVYGTVLSIIRHLSSIIALGPVTLLLRRRFPIPRQIAREGLWNRLRKFSQARTFRPVKRPDDGSNREIGEGYALVSVGITFALTLAGFTLGGFWLDGRFHTTPLLTILGMVVGTGLGGFWLWQRVGRPPKGPGNAS